MQVVCVTGGPVGTNTYILWDGVSKSAAIIDPAEDAEKILAMLSSYGLSADKLLLTHGHFDHIGACDELAMRTGAEIYCSNADAELLYDGNKNASRLFLRRDILCRSRVNSLFDGDTVSVGSLVISVCATPGHTRGSLCYFAEDAVFTGDTVFAYGHGRTDLYGGDAEMLKQSIELLSPKLKGKTIYPGHGETKKFL